MSDVGYTNLEPWDFQGEFNRVSYICRQMMERLGTMLPVQVQAVDTAGGVAATGTVDVQPLVTMLDGQDNATQHGTLRGLTYFRLQGGTNAVIIDPVVGDVGLAVFAMRDISSVVANRGGPANPGSRRTYDLADGIYLGGVLNGAPKQYVQFTATGVVVADANGNSLQSGPGGWTFKGTVTMGNVQVGGNVQLAGSIQGSGGGTYAGNIVTSGNVTASGVDLLHHLHSGVSTGGAQTGPPVAGT